jgi:hypothetical protein
MIHTLYFIKRLLQVYNNTVWVFLILRLALLEEKLLEVNLAVKRLGNDIVLNIVKFFFVASYNVNNC